MDELTYRSINSQNIIERVNLILQRDHLIVDHINLIVKMRDV